MSIFTWSDVYSIGNEEIDRQHKKLFDILNSLYEKCMTEDESGYALAFNTLSMYYEQHMSTEEQYMKDVNYADKEAHVCLHHIIIKKIKELHDICVETDKACCRRIIFVLADWLVNHDIEDDKKFIAQ